jgi:hypothetical protein
MDDPMVGFPEEADNTQFAATPLLSRDELLDVIAEFLMREDADTTPPATFDFSIENEHFTGTVRIFAQSKDYFTTEFEDQPMLFFLSGPGVLLDELGNETDLWLEVGGQLDVTSDTPPDTPPGVLTVWRSQPDQEIGLQDAS